MNNAAIAAEIGAVLTLAEVDAAAVAALLARYGLHLIRVADGIAIPGSFWGEMEAGLIADSLHARGDTPLHSILHEACHWICMDGPRRAVVHTDAGGGYDEEDAVCYLSVLLADAIPGFGRERMWADMDAWGYSFRLGSARAWFEQDAEDDRAWLLDHRLITADDTPTYQART